MSQHPLTVEQIREVVGTDEDRERWSAQDAFVEHEAARQDQLTREVFAALEADREHFVDRYSSEGYLDREAERQIAEIRETRARRRQR